MTDQQSSAVNLLPSRDPAVQAARQDPTAVVLRKRLTPMIVATSSKILVRFLEEPFIFKWTKKARSRPVFLAVDVSQLRKITAEHLKIVLPPASSQPLVTKWLVIEIEDHTRWQAQFAIWNWHDKRSAELHLDVPVLRYQEPGRFVLPWRSLYRPSLSNFVALLRSRVGIAAEEKEVVQDLSNFNTVRGGTA